MTEILTVKRHSIQRMVILLGVVAALFAWSSPTAAALLVYEPFDYRDRTILHGTAATGQNLAGAYQSPVSGFPSHFQLLVQGPGLDYGNLSGAPLPTGNLLTQSQDLIHNAVTVEVDDDVLIDPGQVIYWSTLFQFNKLANRNHRAGVTFMNDDNDDALHFGALRVGHQAIRVEADTSATGGLISDGADHSFSNGDTLLIIGRYINSTATNGDRLDLLGYSTEYANVLPRMFNPADPNADFAYELSDVDIDMAKITSITFTIHGTNNNFIDELRIGTTYGSVAIPEPVAVSLLMFGAWMSTPCRRRR